jgi:hypothetical protein
MAKIDSYTATGIFIIWLVVAIAMLVVLSGQ